MAYSLIIVMAAIAIAIILYLRHNTHDRRIARRRQKERELLRERAEEEGADTL